MDDAAAPADNSCEAAPTLPLTIKYAGKSFPVEVSLSADVATLKHAIRDATGVEMKRQKLLNVKAGGKFAGDDVLVANCGLKKGAKVMMMGASEADIAKVHADESKAPPVEDDFDIDEHSTGARSPLEDQEVLTRLDERCRGYAWQSSGRWPSTSSCSILGTPRETHKLLVLDIDYTLFDHRSVAERPMELARPYLHEFLARSYARYDIVIWSATGMGWVELKMHELGVLDHSDFKILALMDDKAMVTARDERRGAYACKPLKVLWTRFPGFGPHNTVMFDDLRRNFVLNPSCGLKIKPFKRAHTNRHDDELRKLAGYLEEIADVDDFGKLDHSDWERYSRHASRRDRGGATEQDAD